MLWVLVSGPGVDGSWRPPELLVREGEPERDFGEIRGIAFSYLGRPYVMGGVGSPAFDCSPLAWPKGQWVSEVWRGRTPPN